jgi:hypothetical protein
MKRLLALAVLGCLTGALAAQAPAGSLPTLLGSNAPSKTGFFVRPAEIVYTGDGTGILGGFDRKAHGPFGRLNWSSWTATRALGSGAVWLDNCDPSCAGGKFSPYAVKLQAFRPVGGHFTRLTFTYTYKGKTVTDRWGLQHLKGAGWSYQRVKYLS